MKGERKELAPVLTVYIHVSNFREMQGGELKGEIILSAEVSHLKLS